MNHKILFIHQWPHPVHAAFANSIKADWKRYGDNHKEILVNLIKSFPENNDYDVIFSEGGLGLPYAFLKKLFKPNLKIILLNADNFFYILPKSSWIKQKLMKFLLSYVDSIIAISKMNKNEASKYFNEKIYVVNSFGVNNYFDNNPDLKSNKLLFIGSYRADKRYDILIEAVKLLNTDNDKFELYLIGSCCDKINYEYSWLHKEGFQTDIKPYLKKCSIYIHPTDFDPCPVTIFEAMSAGILTLITKCTGQSDIFRENNLDYLILKNNNPETIAKKIIEIYEKPIDWKKQFSDISKDLSRDFSEERQVEKFKEIFMEILK